MTLYTTKPFQIEAVQFTGKNVMEIMDEFTDIKFDESIEPTKGGHTHVLTVWDYLQETWVQVNTNDFIIKGMKGEYYPCAADVFEAKYVEIVSDAPPTDEEIEDAINVIRSAISVLKNDADDARVYTKGKVAMLRDEIAVLEESKEVPVEDNPVVRHVK